MRDPSLACATPSELKTGNWGFDYPGRRGFAAVPWAMLSNAFSVQEPKRRGSAGTGAGMKHSEAVFAQFEELCVLAYDSLREMNVDGPAHPVPFAAPRPPECTELSLRPAGGFAQSFLARYSQLNSREYVTR